MEIMRLSKQYAPTLKEDPADAEIASHRLLVRAGMIRKVAGGVYTFLPLGMRVLTKIENIVREEMDAIGAHEILMPALQPGELWHESGRWNDYGPELMRLEDRHGRGFCLGPTHEELVTSIVRSELRSYRQLPMTLYQIQTKFRDEIRPRFGLLRSREFVMKDAYSFHSSQESLQKTYDSMYAAYGRICERCGLDYRPVEADGGQIGGSVTCEFHALADAGEDDLVYCPDCDYAANTEAGACHAHAVQYDAAECKKIETPGVDSIESLAKFLGIDEAATVKAMVGKDPEGKVVAFFVPGNHELNEIKAERVLGFGGGEHFELCTDEELEAAGLCKGSIGPKGLPAGIKVIADHNLKGIERWVVGANEHGFHFVGAKHGEDFQVDEWADLSLVQPGDSSPSAALPCRAPAASRSRRCSSSATSTPAPWERCTPTKTAWTRTSSWAATAWAFPVPLPPSWSSITTRTASSGRSPSPRRTFAWCPLPWATKRCSRLPSASRRNWPIRAWKWSWTTATSAPASSLPMPTLSAGPCRLSLASAA